VTTWAAVDRYFQTRVQSEPEQKPGRKPDMSSEAGMAMRAVLSEVGVAAVDEVINRTAVTWSEIHHVLCSHQQAYPASESATTGEDTLIEGFRSFIKNSDECAEVVSLLSNGDLREEAAKSICDRRQSILEATLKSTFAMSVPAYDPTGAPMPRFQVLGSLLFLPSEKDQQQQEVSLGASVRLAEKIVREACRQLMGNRPGMALVAQCWPEDAQEAVAWGVVARTMRERVLGELELSPEVARILSLLLRWIAQEASNQLSQGAFTPKAPPKPRNVSFTDAPTEVLMRDGVFTSVQWPEVAGLGPPPVPEGAPRNIDPSRSAPPMRRNMRGTGQLTGSSSPGSSIPASSPRGTPPVNRRPTLGSRTMGSLESAKSAYSMPVAPQTPGYPYAGEM